MLIIVQGHKHQNLQSTEGLMGNNEMQQSIKE